MKRTDDHARYQELLYLEPDGELSAAERGDLERHVTACAACRSERPAVARLDGVLALAAADIDDSFRRRVVSALPEAAWETRSAVGLRLAAAVLVLLVAGSVVIGLQAGSAADGPLGGPALALIGLFGSAAAAGAGLLAASWEGVGLALGDVFRNSPVAFLVFAVFVLGIDFLVVRHLLRRRRRVAQESVERGSAE